MYAPMAMVRTGPAYTMAEGPGWMVMVGISVPLWRGKLRAGVAEASAMVDMATADLEAMRRMAEGEARGARETVVAARERYRALRDDIVPRAEQAIAPTLAAYSAGQVPLVSVVEAAQALWTAQRELVDAPARSSGSRGHACVAPRRGDHAVNSFLKDHPWRSGALLAFVVLAARSPS